MNRLTYPLSEAISEGDFSFGGNHNMNQVKDNIPTILEEDYTNASSEEMHSLNAAELREQLQSLPDGIILTIHLVPGGNSYGKS